MTFLRLHEQTAERQFANLAEKALLALPDRPLSSNLGQCHGLSGVGEVYLEAARLLPDGPWAERAQWIASALAQLAHVRTYKGATWLAEDPWLPTADLMVGSGGVTHFMLRHGKPGRLGPPLLFSPCKG